MPDAQTHWRVHVLCAQWCGVCRDYRPFVESQHTEAQPWVWVDVETHADALGDLDIENFPTLLITCNGQPRFLGTVTPQPDVARRLLQALQDGNRYELPAINDLADVTRKLAGL